MSPRACRSAICASACKPKPRPETAPTGGDRPRRSASCSRQDRRQRRPPLLHRQRLRARCSSRRSLRTVARQPTPETRAAGPRQHADDPRADERRTERRLAGEVVRDPARRVGAASESRRDAAPRHLRGLSPLFSSNRGQRQDRSLAAAGFLQGSCFRRSRVAAI